MRRYCTTCLNETPERGVCRCVTECPDCGRDIETHGDVRECYDCAERLAIVADSVP